MLNNILLNSLTLSAIILILLILLPVWQNRYSAKWRYFVWLILAIRLIIPFRIELQQTLLKLPSTQNYSIFIPQDSTSISLIDDLSAYEGSVNLASNGHTQIISLHILLLLIWVAGVLCFFVYHVANYIFFKKRIKPGMKTIDSEILTGLLTEMNIVGKKPQLFECDKIASPLMIGFFKPVILLPKKEYSTMELCIILNHELTHFKRKDLWYKLLLLIANGIHWFNPIVYLMIRQANRDLEYSCDDAVIRNSDISFRKAYSLTILKTMQQFHDSVIPTNINGGKLNE